MAAQDQALNTRYYSKHIIKQGSTDRCRMCHTLAETVEHIISGCQALAADKYLNRHNQVAAQLHLDICVMHQQDHLLLSQLRLTFPSSMDRVRSRNRSKLPHPSELDNC